ncbi:MAG: ABC transporter substrate-binding protein [Ilumatobacteraceae bacterium]
MERAGRCAAVLVASVLLAACGGSSSGNGTAAATTTAPITVTDGTGRTVTITSADRVIPVDGDLAEVAFALGMGDHVVATDLSATYPPEADALPQIGYQRALSAEPIAAFEPTLVLATDLAGPPEVLDELRRLGIPVVVITPPPTVDGAIDKVEQVAAALGVPERGEALAATMRTEIDAATARAATFADHPKVAALYLRGGQTQLVFGKGSGIDSVIDAAGGIDVGTSLGVDDYADITAEAMIRADPDVILVSTTGLESVGGLEGLAAVASLAQTSAVRNGRVLAYEDQYLFGIGPRVGQLLDDLVTALHEPGAATSTPTT